MLLRIAKEPGGLDVAIDIFYMRLSFDEGRRQSSTSELIDLGRELIRQLRLTNRRDDRVNRTLAMIAKFCLVEDGGAAIVREVCRNLREAILKAETRAFYHSDLLQILLGAQPLAVLEAFGGDNAADLQLGISILDEAGQLRSRAFDRIPEADLLTWCDQQPETRYVAVARGITAFRANGETGLPQWTSTARKLLEKAPDPAEVVKTFIRQFSAVANGSQVPIAESYGKFLDELALYPDAAIHQFVANEKIRFAGAIEAEKHKEPMVWRQSDERFE